MNVRNTGLPFKTVCKVLTRAFSPIILTGNLCDEQKNCSYSYFRNELPQVQKFKKLVSGGMAEIQAFLTLFCLSFHCISVTSLVIVNCSIMLLPLPSNVWDDDL